MLWRQGLGSSDSKSVLETAMVTPALVGGVGMSARAVVAAVALSSVVTLESALALFVAPDSVQVQPIDLAR